MKNINTKKIILLLLFILVINNVFAIDATVELNKSSLPYSNNLIINIEGQINSTVNITYDSIISGASTITFDNINNHNLSINYNIPFEIQNDNFISTINVSNNNTYLIQFNIIDDIKFEINTLEYYFVNEIVNLDFKTPINTLIDYNITGAGTNYNSNIISTKTTSTREFIPTKIGNYEINTKFNYNNVTETKYNEFMVYEKLSCEIESTSEIYENESINFNVKIIGGIGSITYLWDFDDSSNSNIQKPTHRFISPKEYDIELRIEDSEGYSTICTKKIDVKEETFEVIFRLTDNQTGKKIGDANVTFGDDLKKSNVNGIVKFLDIQNGKYEIEIIKKDYDIFKSEYKINEDKTINVSLIKTPEDKKPIPFITLLYPLDNAVIEKETSNFDFTVKSNTNIENCYLLINEVNNLGYKIKGTINNVKNNIEYSLDSDLTNGEYKWNVQCENTDGINKSVDRFFTVRGITEKIINNNQENDNNNADENNNEDETVSETNTIEVNKEVNEFDQAIKEINTFKKSIVSSDSTTREIVELLKINSQLEQSLSELKKLKQNMIDLQALSINLNDKNRKKSEYLLDFKNIKAKTPTNILLLNEKHYEINTLETDVETAVKEYLTWKKINLSKSKLKKYIKNVKEAQENLHVKTDLNIIKINYLDQHEMFMSIVTKEVDDKEIKGNIFFELIPSYIAKSTDKLSFSTGFENINNKAIAKIDTNFDEKFSYFINKNVNIDELVKINSVALLDLNHPNNKITGFAILDSDSFSGKFFLIFVLIGIVISGNYFIFYKDQTMRNKVVQNFIQTKNSLKIKSNDEKLTGILHNVMDLLNEKNTKEALSHYPKVLELFNNVDNKLQNDLKPIISHLYYELEIYNLNNMIRSAYSKSLTGVWHEAVDEYNEIHDIIPEIPNNFKPKITKKLNKLDLTMNIHMLKSHTETNQYKSVDDSLFSRRK
jgi:hypothetical protein